MQKARHLSLLSTIILVVSAAHARGDYVNSELPWHDAVLDGQGKLLAWYQPKKNLGYDKVLRLAWDFIEHKVPNDPKSGLKVYLVNAVFDAKTLQGTNWQGNPASTFGQFVDSVITWYPYSGDEEAIAVVRSMLDHQLAHGTTPADWNWSKVPFATTSKNDPEYGRSMRGMPRDYYGGIETDKVGELGVGYVEFYELTGDEKYLNAAVACAEALAAHVRDGDEAHTPWPFRVDAKTGEVLNGEEYGGMIVAPLRLFAELIRIKHGNFANYAKAQKRAWDRVMKFPMHNNAWSGYFEDVPKDTKNMNQASPTMTAYYLLRSTDPAAIVALDGRCRTKRPTKASYGVSERASTALGHVGTPVSLCGDRNMSPWFSGSIGNFELRNLRSAEEMYAFVIRRKDYCHH